MKTIAITTNLNDQQFYLAKSDAEVIANLGFLPIILPVLDQVEPVPGQDFAALVVTDGSDLTPICYNEEPLPSLGKTNLARDRYEIKLVKKTYAAGIPILGIGRGMQLMNVAFGGSLYQDLLLQNPTAGIQHMQQSSPNQPTHHLNVVAKSLLAKSIGTHPYVNSLHHQALKTIAAPFDIVASASDGIVEAIETADGKMLGVQWRPDLLFKTQPEQAQLYKDFLTRV